MNVEETSEFDLLANDAGKAQKTAIDGQPGKTRNSYTDTQTVAGGGSFKNSAVSGNGMNIRDSKKSSEPNPALPPRENASRIPPPETKGSSQSEVDLNLKLVEACETAERLEKYKTECESLRQQVSELTKNLQEQEDFIFSLQPRREIFTGWEAAAEFKSLCGSVENWVQTTLGDAIDDRQLEKQREVLEVPAKDFLELIGRPARESFGVIDTDVYQVIGAVMKFLGNHIFDQEWYCQVGKGRTEFLSQLWKSVAKLQPRRDLSAQRTWRSESLAAFANLPDFAPYRQLLSDTLSVQLCEILRIFLPGADKHALITSIQESIIEPSMILAHKMQISVDKFSFEWSSLQRTKPEKRFVIPRDFEAFEPVDISGRTLKFPAAGEGSAGRGYITYLFDLCPRLIYEPVKGDSYKEPQILKKSRILVVATKEEDGPFLVPNPIPGRPVTLLGWLEEIVHPKRATGWKSKFLSQP